MKNLQLTLILISFITLTLCERQLWMSDLNNRFQTSVSGWTDLSSNPMTSLQTCQYQVQDYIGNVFGPFANSHVVQKTFYNIPPHWSLAMTADYIIEKYWQNDYGTYFIDATQYDMSPVYTSIGQGLLICRTGYSTDTNANYKDVLWPIYQNITHSASQVLLKFRSSLSTGVANELWLLHNVNILIDRCFVTCATCTGPADNQCQTCPPGSTLSANGKCKCQTGYSFENLCIGTCPVQYTIDTATRICVQYPNYYCTTFIDANTCSQCQLGYFVLAGNCVQSCPSWTVSNQGVCDDITKNTFRPEYLLKSLFTSTFTNKDFDEWGLTLPEATSGTKLYSDCGGTRILGGFGIFQWGALPSFKIQKTFTSLPPHFSARIVFQAYFIDAWISTDYLKVYVDGTQKLLLQKPAAPNSGLKHICGWYVNSDSSLDYVQQVDLNITHTSGTLALSIEFQLVNPRYFMKSGGIRDLHVIIDKCNFINCAACTSGSGCSGCSGADTLNGANQCQIGTCAVTKFFDKDRCSDCGVFCNACTSPTTCSAGQCQGNRLPPACSCPSTPAPGTYEDSISATCPSCSIKCNTCTGNQTNCINCASPRINPPNCLCPDGMYESPTGCANCANQCLKCTGQSTNCLVCKGNLRFPIPDCFCLEGYFEDGVSTECQTCNNKCATCQGTSTQCLSCKGNRQNFPICSCPDQTYEDGTSYNCPKCSPQCLTCTAYSTCTACRGNRINPPTCNCPKYFFDDNVHYNCQLCDQKCDYCGSGPATTCSQCKGNRITAACTCPSNTYEDYKSINCPNCANKCQECSGLADNCVLCKGDRTTTNCTCVIGKYDDYTSLNCQICQTNCYTCEKINTNCLSCKGMRVNPPTCSCPDGFFEASPMLANCQPCNNECLTCQVISSKCYTCKGDRIYDDATHTCNCPDGKYDDWSSEFCQKCSGQLCTKCTSGGCFECEVSNRITSGMNCVCPVVRTFYPITIYCATCTYGIAKVFFTPEFLKLIIDFNYPIQFKSGVSQPYCIQLFTGSNLTALGVGALCQLLGGAASANQIEITLGTSATIGFNDIIVVQPNVLQDSSCTPGVLTLNQFNLTTVQWPPQPLAPGAYPIQVPPAEQPLSLCNSSTLSIGPVIYDGNRPLKNILWILVKQNPINSTTAQRIQDLLDNATSFQELSLTIPAMVLDEFSSYVIMLKYENFLGVKGSTLFSLQTTSFEFPEVQMVEKSSINGDKMVFKTHDTINLTAEYRHWKCDQGFEESLYDPLKVQWSQVSGPSLGIAQTVSSVQDNTNITYSIPPFTAATNSEYVVKAQVTIFGKNSLTAASEVKFKVVKSDLVVYIKGGNRNIGFGQPLVIEAIADDPDTPINDTDVLATWTCINLNTNQPCTNIDNIALNLNTAITPTPFKLSIPAKSLFPFNTYNFRIQGTKDTRSKSDSILVVVQEEDLPSFEVNFPARTINLNDFIYLQLASDDDVDVDKVYISVNLLFKFESVGSAKMNYRSFKVRMWDIIPQIESVNNKAPNEITMVIKMYDPGNFLLAQSQTDFSMNPLPELGTMIISPDVGGNAITSEYTISVNGFDDPNTPLTYSYSLYLDEASMKKDIWSGTDRTRQLLTEFSLTSNEITLRLPSGNSYTDNYKVFVLCQVSDSRGGVRNLTQSVEVKPLRKSIVGVDNVVAAFNEYLFSLYTEMQLTNFNIAALELQKISYQDAGDQKKIVALKKRIFDLIKTINSQHEGIMQQTIRSMAALADGGAIWELYGGQDMQQQFLDNMDYFDKFITKSVQKLQALLTAGVYRTDFFEERKKQELENILIASVGLVDQLVQFSSRHNLSYTNIENSADGFAQKVRTLVVNISDCVLSSVLPNQEPYIYIGDSMNFSVSRITQKSLFNRILTSDKKTSFVDNNNQDSAASGTGDDTESDSTATTTTTTNANKYKNVIFQVLQVVYKVNLYRNSQEFSKKKFIYAMFPVYDIVVKQEGIDGRTSLFNITETPIIVPFTLSVDFKTSQEQKPQCIQRMPLTGEWTGQYCSLRESTFNGNQKQLLCKCKYLAETTLVYTDSSVTLVQEIVVMDVKESMLFWIIIAQTGLWALILPWALIKDSGDEERWAKIMALDEQETRERNNSNDFKDDKGINNLPNNNEQQSDDNSPYLEQSSSKKERRLSRRSPVTKFEPLLPLGVKIDDFATGQTIALIKLQSELDYNTHQGFFKKLIKAHPFFSAFYLFDSMFSRSWRFTAAYLKMLVYATIIGVLVQQTSQIILIAIALVAGGLISVVIKNILKLFVSSKGVLLAIGVFIFFFIFCFTLFSISLTFLTVDTTLSYDWGIYYLLVFCIDFVLLDPIISFILNKDSRPTDTNN